MIVLHAAFPIDPDEREEALELAENLVEKSNREPGTIAYRATSDIGDENVIRFFERYEDAEALKAHNRTDHFREFEEKLPDLLAGDPEVVQFDVDSATELEL